MTVASRPSGTLDTMIPMRKRTVWSHRYPNAILAAHRRKARITATMVIIQIKWLISTAMGVSGKGEKVCVWGERERERDREEENRKKEESIRKTILLTNCFLSSCQTTRSNYYNG